MPSTSLERQPGLAALPDDVRAALIAAARAFDRLRPFEESDPEQTLLVHHAIELGRHVVLGEEEHDGRRLLVMEIAFGLTHGPLLPELTPREARAVAHAALGHGFKLIAHELGVSVPTVSRILANARRRLAVETHVAMMAMVHARARERVGG